MSSAWLTLSFALIAALLLSSLASIVGMNRMNSAHETSYSALTAGYQLQQSATRLEALSLGLPAGGGTVMNEVEELLEQIALVEKAASEQPALLQAIKDEAESVAALLGQATVNSESIRPAAAELSSAIDTLILELQGQPDSGKTIQSVTTIFLLLLFLLTALIAGYLAVTHDKRMSRSLEKLLRYMNNVSNGNLDANPLSVSDAAEVGELASAVNRMTAHLKEMIKQIAEASEKLTAESHRLSKEATSTMEAALDIDMIISSTAEQAKEQQTGAKETAITIKEIASGIHRNANLLSEVNHSSNASASLADSGHKIISRATEQVNEVNRATDDLNELVTTMRNRAGEISEIVAGINQISEQTNILALNAGIEASRAGEKGRGFSVIAKEIRNLAETSKTSAERIDDLIMLLRTNTEKVAEVLNKGVEETVASVNEAGEMFDSISSSIRSVSQQIEDASATFEEMSAGTDQVLLVTEHQVTHAEQASASFVQVAENAGRQRVTIKEIATSANTLYRIAEKLQQTVTSFRT
ncbi:methyl-accepting chemotaxis protein [Halalkalibacter oceani]